MVSSSDKLYIVNTKDQDSVRKGFRQKENTHSEEE